MPICPPGDPNGKFQTEPCPEEATAGAEQRRREIIADLPEGVVERDARTGEWFLNGNPMNQNISTFQDVISRAIAQANEPRPAGSALPTLSPNTVAQINESARQFDISRQDVAKRQEQEDVQFSQTLAQSKFEFDQQQSLIRDQFNKGMDFDLQKLAVQEARADTNLQFAIKQEENAVKASNRTARIAAAGLQETIRSNIERTTTERVQIQNQSDQFNATQQTRADEFNASMQFAIDNENQRRREFNVQELRMNARDIAEFSQNPGDVGKIAAFLRAGGGGALTAAAQAGEVGFTEESLAPLQGFLGAKSFLEQGIEEVTFDPLTGQQVAAPEFDELDTAIPTTEDITGGDIAFDTAGIRQEGPGIDPANLFLGPGEVSPDAGGVGPVGEPLATISPELTTGPVTSGGTPIVPTAPGAAEPIVRDGEVIPIEPVVGENVFTALKPSGQVEADLAEFDRRIAESGIDPGAAAGMRAQLERQSGERAELVGLADGGTTFSPLRLVGEEGPELEMDNPDGSTTVLSNPQTEDLFGQFAVTDEQRKAAQLAKRSADPLFGELRSTSDPDRGFLHSAQPPNMFLPQPVAQQVSQPVPSPAPERQPLGLATPEEANIFQRGVSEEAFRRIGVGSAAEATPIKVGAPGTSQFLRDAALGAIRTTGLFNDQTFLERLREVQATGVRAGTSRRTA